jgi:dolichol-phosphate mannosyltransferase
MGRILVMIPTYNEIDNVHLLFHELIDLPFHKDILFIDDNSPDGTGKELDKLKIINKNMFVMHRTQKKGIGSAHYEGIKWAYENNYDLLVTMDCDFTHSPKAIIDFIENLKDNDVVVGSRYMKSDSLKGWNLFRKFLTNLGHFLTRYILGLHEDATGAFRLYNIKKLPFEVFDLVTSKGYSFFFESLFIISYNKFRIKEIPIDLPARTYGNSKMEVSDALKSLKYLMLLLKRKYLNSNTLKL